MNPEKKSLFRKIKDYFTNPEISAADLLFVLITIILIIPCWKLYMPFSEAFTKTVDITYGYNAKQDEQGLYYVIDDGHNRLLCFDSDSNIQTMLVPVDEDGNSLYIDDFAVADGKIYITASVWDGMLVGKEVIAEYQGEEYIRTISERDYSEILVNKHRFYGISIQDNILSYAENEDNAIILHHVSLENGEEHIQRLFYDNAFNAVSDCAFYQDKFYVMDKSGIITMIEDNERTVIYSVQWDGEKERTPYRMTVSPDGNVYFTDIRQNQALQIDMENKTVISILPETFSQTINFSQDGTSILYLEDEGLQVATDSGVISYLTLYKNTKQIVTQIVWFVFVVLLVIMILLLLIRLIISSLKRKHTQAQMLSAWVVSTVAIVSVVLCGMLIFNFSGIYREQYMSQIENSAVVLASQIPEGTLSEINLTEDFDNMAYRNLIAVMEDSFPADLDFNRQLYCNILKLADDGETAYAVAYLDQSIGSYFPLDEIDTAEVIQAYQFGSARKSIWNDGVADISGTYISVKVPIYQAGSVVGVVMVGSDMYVIQEMITNLQKQILFSILIILILLWLTITELLAWVTNKERYQERIEAGDTAALPGHLIRLLVFAIFACYNMTATFLPVWILKNSEVFSESSRDFMASLPITINIFIMGVMSLFTASAMQKIGLKKILVIGSASSLIGNFLMFLLPSYFTVCIGLVLDGIGVGLITNALYIMLTYIKNEDDQQWGFILYNNSYLSGANYGMLGGSSLAVLLSQRVTFAIVAGIWLCLMIAGTVLVKRLENILTPETDVPESETTDDTGDDKHSVGKFLFNKPVMSFIVLIQNPYIVFNSFVFYVVPLFCEKIGYDETIASLLIILYSEIAILTSDMLTKYMTKLLGNFAMYAAYIIKIIALLIFAFTQNMSGLLFVLFLMGIADAYGKTLQQTWFLKQKQVRKFGEDNSMGVYNFSENIGESLGPIIFSSLMASKSMLGAASIFSGILFAAGGGHLLLNRKELKETQ